MSFFGFDPSQPPSHNSSAPGFSQPYDAFAGLSRPDDDDEGIDFEDTYDGLGDQLDETLDDFNDDTFGGGDDVASSAAKPVGKDFDFFGQTAKVSDAIGEEQLRYARQQPAAKPAPAEPSYAPQSFTQPAAQRFTQPAKTGYERYNNPEYLREIEADESIWGGAPKKAAEPVPAPAPASSRKMMSLEEVEAAMRAQSRAKPAAAQQPTPSSMPQVEQYQYQQPAPQQYAPPQQYSQDEYQRQMPPQQQPVQILQRSQPTTQQPTAVPVPQIPQQPQQNEQRQPMQILQNPNRLSGQNQFAPQMPMPMPLHGHPGHVPVVTHPQQLANMTEEQRNAFLEEHAKRAKRNHKIFLLSKDNGLMTPQDKNFITRIQLQQLVTATGNPNVHGSDSALAEDFYYQVHNQIRGGPRQNPNQPLSNFAQTYLYQTGGRHGNMRRHGRGGDNHVQRMEQQVQRAVEAAKNKPKNKQLVIEGSLGKISFSNAKTPKPLLNIKRHDSSADGVRPGSAAKTQHVITGDDRKSVLRSIENVYNTLMQMEDHDRQMPPPIIPDDINPELVGLNMDWQAKSDHLNDQLWSNLKVHEPVGATATHPFIAFLSFAKGKKAIPRVFRHVNQEQRTTILTIIAYHLDQLDVIRSAQLQPGETQLSASTRENIELFSLAVMPSLFGYLNEAGLDIVNGVLGLILARTNLDFIARTRIGVSMLTMILSRAELIKQAANVNEQEWEHWYVYVPARYVNANTTC